jgi:CO/xanthine dehydrogenase FAD-binding subunit
MLEEHQDIPAALQGAVRLEVGSRGEQQATLAGVLVGSDGHSAISAALLALDAQVQLAGQEQDLDLDLGNLLHSRTYFGELAALPGRLVTGLRINSESDLFIEVDLQTGHLRPQVILAAARWASGRTRLVVGGWGRSVRLALDAPEAGGLAPALASALAEAGDDLASPAARQAAAACLADRAVRALGIGA